MSKKKPEEVVIPPDTTKLKLDIGAGNAPRDATFKTVDKFTKADYKADMWAIPLPDNSVDEIWSSHALEHLSMAQVPPTLKEWFRILKVGGRAEIEVPNFDYVARYWFTGADRSWAEAMVFGNQAHAGEFHKCAFTSDLLKGDLEAAGFTVKRIEIVWSHSQETIKAVIHKEEPQTKADMV